MRVSSSGRPKNLPILTEALTRFSPRRDRYTKSKDAQTLAGPSFAVVNTLKNGLLSAAGFSIQLWPHLTMVFEDQYHRFEFA